MAIDLHIHSTVSDGTLTPAQIVRTAVDIGLRAIALADHDSIGGVRQAMQEAKGTSLRVIPAVEINTAVNDEEIHILGYFVDIDDPTLNEQLHAIRNARLDRAEQIIGRLNNIGVPLRMEQVLAVSAGDSVGRPHIARALAAMGACRSEAEAFERYLKVGRPAYVHRYRLSPLEAINAIRAAGGLAVVAHPVLVHDDELILDLKSQGLSGVEAYHCEHSPSVTRYYLEFARRHGLVVTGGSDSHGPESRRPVAMGAVVVPEKVLSDLEEAAVMWRASL